MKTLKDIVKSLVDLSILIESKLGGKAAAGSDKKKVLILRKDGLGDCIVFYATLSAYRSAYPDADITLVFPRWFESLAPLLEGLVDRIVWFDHVRFAKSFSYRRRFLLDLARAGYDVALYPTYTREAIGDFMMKMTGAAEIAGFDGDRSIQGPRAYARNSAIYTRLIRPPQEMKSELDRDAYFIEQISGRPARIAFPSIDVAKLPTPTAASIAGLKATYAVIFPGAGAPYRIWPLDRFARIVEHLAEKGIQPVICAGPKERELANGIIRLAKGPILDLSGSTDLPALAHILAGAKLYFGSDTGIMHLAVAVGTPTVGLIGKGGLWRFFPYGDPRKNRALYDPAIADSPDTGTWSDAPALPKGAIHPSILAITVEQAKKAINDII